MKILYQIKKLFGSSLCVTFLFLSSHLSTHANPPSVNIPFSTSNSHLTIWNGNEYVPFFLKAINLGVAVPGTFPGELAATRSDYGRWFRQIKDAGFNAIRIYTLHYPRFYEVLDSFNLANPHNPLLFIQGVWLEEELYDYAYDLKWLTPSFRGEIKENIDAIHGNRSIAPRLGKAFGNFTTDVSRWCLAFIIGREIHGKEVKTTDSIHAGINRFIGNHLGIENASPSEVWAAQMLDYALSHQQLHYNTQRPISISSWPTLDPLTHPEEQNPDEDLAHIDLSRLQLLNAPAGFFISYHAYPYYPDFISWSPSFQGYYDEFGPNSYLGYLKTLRNHYNRFPFIIGEYGVPSSWVNGHFSTSGMNHGGFDEKDQGLNNLRILNTIRSAGAGGGIQFSWLDEWFKRTWVVDQTDANPEDRVLWGNKSSPEQNFGLVSFSRTIKRDTLARFALGDYITHIAAEVDYSYLSLEIGLDYIFGLHEEMWVALDTYSPILGETVLPNGVVLPPGTRAEFALHITNHSAKLYVTFAYDVFNIWHGWEEPGQLFRSTPSNGAPWNLVRIRTNHPYRQVHFIGNLQVRSDFQPPSTLDAVVIRDRSIKINLPWNYINFVAPNRRAVIHDTPLTRKREDTISDGIQFSIRYRNTWFAHNQRFTWQPWHYVKNTPEMEQLKKSYFVFKDNQSRFNTRAIAFRDNYHFQTSAPAFFIPAENGLLRNDFDLDGNTLITLVSENPKNGRIALRPDGSFTYIPNTGFYGTDSLRYVVFDGNSLSVPNWVTLRVDSPLTDAPDLHDQYLGKLHLYPNPAFDIISIRSAEPINQLHVFDLNGRLIEGHTVNHDRFQINVSNYQPGVYIVIARTNRGNVSGRFLKR